MPVPPQVTYTPSRCHAIFGCWVVDNQFVIGPQGWTVTRTALGQYRITPTAADVPDTRYAVPITQLYWMDTAAKEGEVMPPPDGRTFLVVPAPGYYDVHIKDVGQAYVDASFSFFLLTTN